MRNDLRLSAALVSAPQFVDVRMPINTARMLLAMDESIGGPPASGMPRDDFHQLTAAISGLGITKLRGLTVEGSIYLNVES